jgi:hypothetical protein
MLKICIQRCFGGKIVRQQHLTGVAKHFVFLIYGNAFIDRLQDRKAIRGDEQRAK